MATVPSRAALPLQRPLSSERLRLWQYGLTGLTMALLGTYVGRVVLLTHSGYLPELYVLPLGIFLMLFRTKGVSAWASSLLHQRLLIALLLTVTLAAAIGLILGGDPKSNYTHYRTILAFICSYHFFRTRANIYDRPALFLILMALVAYLLYIQYAGTTTTSEDQAEKNRFPVIASVVGLLIAIRMDRKIFGALISGISIYLSVLSNYRIDLGLTLLWALIFLFCALFGLGISKPRSGRHGVIFFFLRVLVFGGAIAAAATFAPTISLFSDFLTDDQRYSQLVTKSETAWNVVTGSAQSTDENSLGTRIHIVEVVFDNWPSLLTPVGLGPDDAIHRIYHGNDISTLDSGIGFAALHFGIICGLLLAYLAYKDFGRMLSFKRPLDLIMAGTLLIYFLVTGEALGIFELAFASGACLGIYRRYLYPAPPIKRQRTRR